MRIFKETQKFTQTWLMILLAISLLVPVGIILKEYTKQGTNVTTRELILTISLMVVSLSPIFIFKLITRIDERGIHYCFFPIHRKLKLIYLRNYNPISEYGGWGLKTGWGRKRRFRNSTYFKRREKTSHWDSEKRRSSISFRLLPIKITTVMIRIITFIILQNIGFFISYGQDINSKEIKIFNNKIELSGTLSYTKKSEKLIIWIHGSGNIDRNGNQGSIIKANYIKQFRDSINQHHIAFFSYDKRTANLKNKKFLTGIKFTDLVNDTKTVINHFRAKKQFKQLILIGHSQGSLVAMLASEKIDKYISLAGAGEPIDITIVKQIQKQNPTLSKIAKDHIKELKETGGIKEVNPFLVSLFAEQNQPFLTEWLRFNPATEISKLTIPVLIINGLKDMQVKEEDANKLHASNKDSRLILIGNMNHVLKTIKKDSDNMASYYSSDFPISKKLIEVIAEFVKQ